MDHAVNFGGFSMTSTHAALINEHVDMFPNESIASAGSNCVLHLSEFGKAFVHEAGINLTVQVIGICANLTTKGEESTPIEISFLDELNQCRVVVIGLA